MNLNPSQRYWLSMAGIVLGTLLVVGLVGGAVAARLGPDSLVSGTVVVAILLGGWALGSRVTERKKLDLPLWHRLTAAQTSELSRFREFKRTGRVLEPEDEPKAAPRAADRSLSRKDRARMADVERRRAARRRSAAGGSGDSGGSGGAGAPRAAGIPRAPRGAPAPGGAAAFDVGHPRPVLAGERPVRGAGGGLRLVLRFEDPPGALELPESGEFAGLGRGEAVPQGQVELLALGHAGAERPAPQEDGDDDRAGDQRVRAQAGGHGPAHEADHQERAQDDPRHGQPVPLARVEVHEAPPRTRSSARRSVASMRRSRVSGSL